MVNLRLMMTALAVLLLAGGARAQTACTYIAGTQTINSAFTACGTAKSDTSHVHTGSNITDGTVANADLANMANATFKCRVTAGSGAPEDCTTAQSRGLLLAEDMALAGDITPTQITADQNDYNPTGLSTATVLRLSTDNDNRKITGLVGGADGRVLVLLNVGSYDLVLTDENSASTAANRFAFGGVEALIPSGSSATLIYDATASRWKPQAIPDNGTSRAGTRRQPYFFTEFLAAATTMNAPFTGAAVSSGTAALNTTNQTLDHPGVLRLSDSTTANGGYRVQTDANSIRLGGGESFELVFNPAVFTNITARFGFHDATTSADAVDGVYFEYSGSGATTCKASSNSTRTTSATIATLSTATWYRGVIKIDRTAANATCTIYDANGVSLGSQTVSSNIPTAAGRETQAGVIATENSVSAAAAIIDVDYMALRFGEGRPMLR